MKKNHLSFTWLVKNFFAFLLLLVFNCLSANPTPLSICVYLALLHTGFSLAVTPILFVLSIFLTNRVLFLPLVLGGAILSLIYFIYRLSRRKPKAEILIYVIVSLIPYFLTSAEFYEKCIVFILSAVLTFAIPCALNFIVKKGIKYKPSFEETFSLAVLTVLLGLGLCNLASVNVFKSLSVVIILLTTYVAGTGVSVSVACLLGISVSAYFSDLSFVGVFAFWSLCSLSLIKTSRFLSAIIIPVCDYIICNLFHLYSYGLTEILFVVAGAIIFCLIPPKFLVNLKENLSSFAEKQLVRQSINRNRSILSGKLYELSGVFMEISSVLTSFRKKNQTDESAKKHLAEQLLTSVCNECENYPKCRAKNIFGTNLDKLLEIGLAKGKISFIDIPTEMSSHCIHANNLIFCVNKLLAEYRNFLIDQINYDKSKALISGQAEGIAEVLKGLAFETGQMLKYHSKTEKLLSETLKKSGIYAYELLIYGEGENAEVGIIICGKELALSKIVSAVNKTLGQDMRISKQLCITEDKTYLLFKRETVFDAVFGVASLTKDGSLKCGDTHSVQRLDGGKFLIALSDGMGSGEYAEKVSDATLSLIESFYKAGMSSPLILSTVNKLLAINTEDTFSALDICVLDLNNLSADFIKYGAPYGFIITPDGIKIVESASLPLGILDDLKPSITTDTLSNNNMVVFVTDGVTDAFGSSSEMIDFLSKESAKNPQSLAENILNKALNLTNGKKADDMTCLCVRVFKRKREIA